ncbi:MAG: hypothetical protein JXB13_19140 [Phycisphaerae bacterium]|nr:hypothetical protein [Phycisphaerae bacterium]
MNARRTWWNVAGILVVAVLLVGAGCKKEEGTPSKPAGGDTVGEKVDKAVDAAKDTAEKAGEAVKDTAKKAGEAVDAAAEKAEDAVESAAGAASDVVKDAKEELTAEAKTEAVAILARADALDGAEDKVITKCAACGLAMDGNDENIIVVEGYTMKFCSPKCKEKFEKEPLKAVLAMEFPDEGETE